MTWDKFTIQEEDMENEILLSCVLGQVFISEASALLRKIREFSKIGMPIEIFQILNIKMKICMMSNLKNKEIETMWTFVEFEEK
jgi:hypothetical protein